MPPPPPGGPPSPPSGATPPPPPPPDGPPWERERSVGGLLQTLKGVLLEPGRTFRDTAPEAGIGWPLLYWLILTAVGTLAGMFWGVISGSAGLAMLEPYARMSPEAAELYEILQGQTAAQGLLYALRVPASLALALLFLFIWTAVVHLLLMLVGGTERSFEATFRAIAYAAGSAAIFEVVPACGWFIGLVWSIVVQIIGVKELQRTSSGKATFAVLAPLLLCFACCIVWAVLVFSFLVAAGQS
ncbi:MAG: YIP1 family protein [Acidobacteriota bacterium]